MIERLILLCVIFVLAKCDDVTVITDRVNQNVLNSFTSSLNSRQKEVTTWIETLNSNGQWPDIDYTDQSPALWKTAEHIVRVREMTALWVYPSQFYFKNATLFEALMRSLDFWLQKDPLNPNWWWNDISVPQSVGETVLLLTSKILNANQSAKAVAIMKRATLNGKTGQNVVWMAYVQVLSGCFQQNQSYVAEAYKKMFDELVFQPGELEGIKLDGIFFQHGAQIYNGGYGAAFVESILDNLVVSAGTIFSYTADQLNVFSTLLLGGQKYTISPKKFSKGHAYYDYSVCGRDITRIGGMLADIDTTQLVQVPGPRAAEYKNLASWLETGLPAWTGNHLFWKGDFISHNAQQFKASVRMYSTRTLNSECINEEGKKSVHMADGVTNFFVSGAEFVDIFPTWDWEKIPGITCEQGGLPLECAHVNTHGTTDFVGGVSDGGRGIAVFDFQSPFSGPLYAKKSWFLFDDFVIALGTGINCATSNPVVTSINQCLLITDVYTSTSPDPLPTGKHQFTNVSDFWVYQDSIGYYVPFVSSLVVSNVPQTGTWQDIGQYQGTVTKPVFSAWIEHPQTANITQDGSYSYAVFPGLELVDFKTMLNQYKTNVKILQNTNVLQAVSWKTVSNGTFAGVVFWTSGMINLDTGFRSVTVTSNYPAVLLIHFGLKTSTFTVGDPTQKLQEIDVTIAGEHFLGPGCDISKLGTVISFELPTGDSAGSSISVTCANEM